MTAADRAARETRYRLGDPTLCLSCLGDLPSHLPHLDDPHIRCGYRSPPKYERCPHEGNLCGECSNPDPPHCFDHHIEQPF